MRVRDWWFYKKQGIRRRLGLPLHQFANAFNVAPDRLSFDDELGRAFIEHRGRPIAKWAHYLPLYGRYFEPYRNKPLKMLEIGVFMGGSLEFWRNYFGPAATLFGIDISPDCATRADPPTQIRIGSQDDPVFLNSVIEEMGQPDIVLDDGSHIAAHQLASFRVLFPLLKPGGLYVIEDMHTAYWEGEYGGGYGRKGTAIDLVKRLIDDMHGWYHDRGQLAPKEEVLGIHCHDSIVFIEKGERSRPSWTTTPPP